MQTAAPLFALILFWSIYIIGVWILWKFYRALARVGEELGEIKTILRLRLPPPARPGDAEASAPTA